MRNINPRLATKGDVQMSNVRNNFQADHGSAVKEEAPRPPHRAKAARFVAFLTTALLAIAAPLLGTAASPAQAAPLAVTTNPSGSTTVGTPITASATGGYLPYAYQWWESSTSSGPLTPIQGAFSNTYTPTSTGYISVSVEDNDGNTEFSAPIEVTPAAPTVSVAPAGPEALGTQLTATTGGTAPITVAWQSATSSGGPWNNVAGATGTTFTPGAIGWYRAAATNGVGTEYSNAVEITPAPSAPVITTQPSDGMTDENLVAAASGYPTPTVQWQRADAEGGSYSDVAGATSDTLAAPMPIGWYRAVYTNSTSTAMTTPVQRVSLGTLPNITSSATGADFTRGTAGTIQTVTASGAAPVTLSASYAGGALPAWLTFDPNTGVLATTAATTTAEVGPHTVTITASNNYRPDATQNVTFKILPMTYTVSFDSGSGSAVAPLTVNENEAAVKPADPTRGGYDFTGWFTDAAATTAYDWSTPVTADLMLYAGWEAKPLPFVPTAKLSTTTVAVNGNVTIDVTGAMPNEEAEIWIFSDPVFLGATTADSSGKISATYALPKSILPGKHTIEVRLQGSDKTLRLPLTVTAGDRKNDKTNQGKKTVSTLEVTGARDDSNASLGIALGLLAGAAAALAYARRRRA